ncbi:MAG: energy-coupling factor transporter transmembrane component T [Desulfurococcus sp.]|nr:energy-coupling factor transporter transmembrane component T [Desulfurococcus sp.]
MQGLTARFIEELREVMEALSTGSPVFSFNPSVAVASAVILASTASFTRGLLAPSLILLASILLAFLLKIDLKAWVKPVVFIAILVGLASTPLLFTTPDSTVAVIPLGSLALRVSWSGLREATALTLRAVAATSSLTAILLYLGWRGLVEGLRGLHLPRELVFMTGLLARYIPLFLSDALSMMAAREARILKPDRRLAFKSISSIIGELLLRGYEVAWRLEKAVKARSFNGSYNSVGFRVGFSDIALLGFTLALTTVCVILEVL